MALSDDQKAMLRLLAQREQGYDDLAALMGLSVEEVRAKVKDALAQLEEEGQVPPPLPPEPIPPVEPAAPKAPEPPEPVPSPARPPAAARPEPAAKASPAPVAESTVPARQRIQLPSSGRGRAGIAAGALAVVALILVLALSGSDSGSGSGSTTAASGAAAEEAAPTAATNSKLTQAVLKPVGDSNGSGIAIFGRIKKSVVLQVQAKGLEPSPKGSSYTVWLYKSPKLALRIGSVAVDGSGGIAAQFPVPTELLAYVAGGAFDQIDLSLTSNAAYEAEVAKAKREKRLPLYTGEDVLRGEITGPAIEAAAKKNAE
jgi:outer membrane biosynthesis protein TonB